MNNLYFGEHINESPYQPPSAGDCGTPTKPSSLRMYTTIRNYPRAVKNKATDLRQLRENGSSMIAMMNFELNSQVSKVQFDSVTATPQNSIIPENGLFSPKP